MTYPDMPIAGIVYQQHKKALPKPGRVLVNGTISTSTQQATTHRMYRQTLINKYGPDSGNWPAANVQFLNQLVKAESPHADAFIRRDFIYRNAKSGQNWAQQLLAVISEMLDPDLLVYPNPSRMGCPMCSFQGPCVSVDDGGDWKHDLDLENEVRPDGYDGWRTELPDPATFKGLKALQTLNILDGV